MFSQLLRTTRELDTITEERNRLADLNELAMTNDQLVDNQAAQLDALRRELATLAARADSGDRTRVELNASETRCASESVNLYFLLLCVFFNRSFF